MAKQTDKNYLKAWKEFRDNTRKATPVDLTESAVDKAKRIKHLESHPEEWFKYYFPNFYTSEPAPFHIKATKRVLSNMEWFEVRSWARELSKSGRTMMEVLYLAMTGKKKNIIMASSTFDNACRLLLPYKSILEANNRIINDYGEQQSIGNWEAGEFVTRKGVSFRAIGKGQTPRGTRKDEVRPDVLLIDDFDTDEECRNIERIKASLKWIEEALIPTRSISGHLLIMVCGNIIAKFCCVTELAKKADYHDIVNIRDKEGKSTWPNKNTEASIDRVLNTISFNSAQKEYFNNPISEGDIFKELTYGKCPPLSYCEDVVVYADPSTSNKDKGNASTKAIAIIGYRQQKYYVYKMWVDTMSNSKFVDCLYEAYKYLTINRVDTKRIYIENNSLQDPFYEQVLLPLIYQRSRENGFTIPITPDSRRKPDKFFRIEGTLEPHNRLGRLIFNVDQKEEPNMVRTHDQMLAVSPTTKIMDAPDAIEGACWLIQNRVVKKNSIYVVGQRSSRKY
ncbi:hypothetical protein [Flavobacterium psychrophilum]|uniref:hypothetical protein n=1 Tax=Flavobacterium psychrophilum TaxID=96345 RepID=UPI000B7C2BF1|nr:hypothetical protein [Flavobacterium psychrophilum]MCB6230854.1 hypothetical protein [Flavobacterium psychrophilum]MEB3380585.1 hypothetical protein [Flavobacterium psychrophilum]SNA87701.1 conserved hypothetical protein [Flavobacterium psychrophilum]SNA88038.1 conserved hypothetical protein [Flavobacterium psychrophilum]SNB14289.1 conserved hypothetical protein [Flavobacterium psychrophilum]